MVVEVLLYFLGMIPMSYMLDNIPLLEEEHKKIGMLLWPIVAVGLLARDLTRR